MNACRKCTRLLLCRVLSLEHINLKIVKIPQKIFKSYVGLPGNVAFILTNDKRKKNIINATGNFASRKRKLEEHSI